MSVRRWRLLPALAALLASAATAQQNSPGIGYVYPAGGRQGETFRVVVGGQYLTGASAAYFSCGGIRAVVIEHNKPLTQKQYTELREQAKQLQERKLAATKGGRRASRDPNGSQEVVEWTAEDEKLLAEIRKKLSVNAPNRQANPAIAESVTLDVTVVPEARPGRHELRLATAAGLSNPLVFCVGQLPEFNERPAHEVAGQRNPQTGPYARDVRSNPADAEMRITLPAVVNGQILPGGVDRMRFTAKKGQRLVAAVSARDLIPYLADAVPGWFQATLALYDAEGRELAYADDYRFNPDPVLFCEIPEDGEYVVEIKDSIYRGREDFVYRIALGELPFVTSIFPLGGPAGTRTRVDLKGWNLPADRIEKKCDGGCGIVDLGSPSSSVVNRQSFAIDALAECLEQESNDSPGGAQQIAIPTIVNGRIDKGGDTDVFCFAGRAGGEIVAEVSARRLGSPLDSVLKLTDAAGRQLAINDDREDKGEGLATHHADSHLFVALPADGTYYLCLGDAQDQGGEEYGYRLRVSPPQPDFELRIVPSSINIRGGATIPLTVYALRKDGFNGDITLVLKDAPEGYVVSGWVPGGQDKVQVTLTAPPSPTDEPITLSLEGRAVIEGHEVVRPVVPADDRMQAFFYRHLVPARELKVAVSGQRMSKGAVSVLGDMPVKIPAGGTAAVRLAVTARSLGGVQLEVTDPPEGIAVEKVTPSRNGAEIVLRCDGGKVKPGLKGNLIVSAFYTRPAAPNDKAPVNRPRVPAATLPAIPFEIVMP